MAPFATERRGVVVNAAIELRAEAELQVGGDRYRLEAKDLAQVVEADWDVMNERDGWLDLLKAAVRIHQLPPCRLTTRSAPPPGKQDQYAAALGGFHRLDFSAAGVLVRPLAVPPAFADWLARHIIVCYTGQSRVSSATIGRVMARFVAREAGEVAALEGLAALGIRMAEALEAGDEREVGDLWSANWQIQQRLDPGMQTPVMARLEQAMADCGSLGGKAAGAGAGGTMFFVIGDDPARAARVAAEQGSTVLPLQWAWEGVRVW